MSWSKHLCIFAACTTRVFASTDIVGAPNAANASEEPGRVNGRGRAGVDDLREVDAPDFCIERRPFQARERTLRSEDAFCCRTQ
jgi:hypothetical protein